MNEDTQLKPCPFCEQEPTKHYIGNAILELHCSDCGVGFPLSKKPNKLIETWNTRPIEDALQAKLDLANGVIDDHKRVIQEFIEVLERFGYTEGKVMRLWTKDLEDLIA